MKHANFTNKVGDLDVYENISHDIVINNTGMDWEIVSFDECMAEKLCKAIMKVAKEIRDKQ